MNAAIFNEQTVLRTTVLAAILAVTGCSASPPPRLFLLGGAPAVASSDRGTLSDVAQGQSGQAYQIAAGTPTKSAVVLVTVPQYLDRPEIMVRTDSYELSAVKGARWAEGLSITASRTVANDLSSLIARGDFFSYPTRIERPVDYQIRVELTKFDAYSSGSLELSGRWSIIDAATEKERAANHFQYSTQTSAVEPSVIVAGMSDLLFKVSAEIAAALRRPEVASRR